MNVDPDVNYDELARSTDDFNGAQCKAVCVEAGEDLNRLLSAGLEPVLSHTQKSWISSYYRQSSTYFKIKIVTLIPVFS